MAQLTIIRIEPGISPDYKKETTGRCHKCNSRFIWNKKLGKLSQMTCPFCPGFHLKLTTHQFKGDTYRLESPYRKAVKNGSRS